MKKKMKTEKLTIEAATCAELPIVSEYTEVDVAAGSGEELDAMLVRLGFRLGVGGMQCWLGNGLHIEYRGTWLRGARRGYTLGLWPIGPTEQLMLSGNPRSDDRTVIIGPDGYIHGSEPMVY